MILVSLALAAPAPTPTVDSGILYGLPGRNIGSAAMSGRIAAIAATDDPSGQVTLFVGAASGGVWKSTDGGTTFRPTFDEMPDQSIGAIAIDPRDASRVWVGTGEAWTRNSVSVGHGIYRSTDGGETWAPMGLPDSERIAAIQVDPRASDTVYACVPGKLWSDSADRGLYKTTDGGANWTLVLAGSNLSTGCASLTMDPKDPDVLFASLWDFRRKGWTFRSGGDGPTAASGSGLFRSADGGKTWTEVTAATNTGFPAEPFGRIAVAVAPSDPNEVYAAVEAVAGGLYRSHDGGKTWSVGDQSQWMVWRPFYFQHVIVDPKDAKHVFKTDGPLLATTDGGASFSAVGGFAGMHGDVHAVWIDPANPKHVIAGDDGGLWISHDGGNRWWKCDNLPVSQFYHVSLDNADPFQVYGGLQDNSSWVGDSEYPGGITSSRWENLYGGDGFYTFPDPTDPDYVYAEAQGGNIGRVNRKTHEGRDIMPRPGFQEKLRFNWNTPIALSPTRPDTLYIGAQFLFRSRDHGENWERISPDLTTNDPAKQKQEESGGITVDNSAAEMHTTIYSIAESPKDADRVWVGTDDGNVQLTRDGGKTWTNVTPPSADLPAASWVSHVEAGLTNVDTAYVTFDRHTFGDMEPYLYRTTDAGAHWTRLVGPGSGSGVTGYAHVVKEDPVRPEILYLGTESGLWISVDGGGSWAAWKGSQFPTVAVRDLAVQVRDDALVIATHGRGIWIIDDLAPLRALTPEVRAADMAFVVPKTTELRLATWGGWANGAAAFVGENPPDGVPITYYLKQRALVGKLTLEVLDASGKVIETLPAGTRRGLNRVVWTMQGPAPDVPPAVQLAGSATTGPRLPYGTYTLRLTRNGKSISAAVTVTPDRRVKWDAAGAQRRYDAAMQVSALFGDESVLFRKIVGLREQIEERVEGVPDGPEREKLEALSDALDGIRKEIVATKEGGAITGEERLREHTDALYGAITTYGGPPSPYQVEAIGTLRRELDGLNKRFDTTLAAQLAPANAALKAAKQPLLVVPDGKAAAPPTGGGGAGGQRDPDEAMPALPSTLWPMPR
jgi:photosystem II stability/assembly factor-like uncharacterized protein